MLRFASLCTILHACACLKANDGNHAAWNDWLRRFPELQWAVTTGDKVQVWSALKDKYWMEFINWKDQPRGFTAYDGTPKAKANHEDGRYSEHIADEFRRWQSPFRWTKPWTVEDVVELNARMRGANTTYYDDFPQQSKCLNSTFAYFQRCAVLAHALSDRKLDHKLYTIWSFKTRRQELGRLLDEYHEVAQQVLTVPDVAYRLHAILPHLATLYAKLALLHPFPDGNSRTRYFILQSELVRFGGHPVMLRDLEEEIYTLEDAEEVRHFILEGWCAWEFAYATGRSPEVEGGYADRAGNCKQPHNRFY